MLVIPAEAGIHKNLRTRDPRLRWDGTNEGNTFFTKQKNQHLKKTTVMDEH